MHPNTNLVLDLLRRRHLHRCRLGILPCKPCTKTPPQPIISKTNRSLQVPETKGRTLEEMDEIFGQGEARFAAEDAARKDRIEREIGLTAILNGDLTGGSGSGSGDDKMGSGMESHEFAGEKR